MQTEDKKAAKTNVQNLKQKITQMEANLKQKEKEVDNMKSQLDTFVAKVSK
jgi:predicted RNase H-like nuclease (RuvC/YqgF family)